MKDARKVSILEKYDSYEAVPAACIAWITMRARKEGKSPTMAKAGYKAAFKRIQNQTEFAILKEDGGYLGGGISSIPIHHVIKARNGQELASKVGIIYDEILECGDKDSKSYKLAMKKKEIKIVSLLHDRKTITVDGTKLSIISEPEYVRIC